MGSVRSVCDQANEQSNDLILDPEVDMGQNRKSCMQSSDRRSNSIMNRW